MFDFIRTYQLDIMLMLCGACAILIFLLVITRSLSKSRKSILIFMELVALFLLWFDRMAYIYAGNPSFKGYVMVRVSNFTVFFLTPAVVFGVCLYIADWMKHEGKMDYIPLSLQMGGALSVLGMFLAVVAAFTDLYYYFDETNKYHRTYWFPISYIIPVTCTVITFICLIQYRKIFTRVIFHILILYLVIPVVCALIQLYAYGISIVNMSLVAVSIFMYICTYVDINNAIVHAHEIEIENLKIEHERMERLFDQTATAFVSAVEKRDDFEKGNSIRIAEYARKIARADGKSEEDCDKVYYAALLHDVGLIGIPDEVLKNDADFGRRDVKIMQQAPVIGEEILSSITEYPYLTEGARYCHEKYNGTGYPDGLKGKDIPEVARIIAVANTYVAMTSKKRYRDAQPVFMAREAFVRGAGEEFDPVFADIMIKIIDSENKENSVEITSEAETEIACEEYRERVSSGISVENTVRKISFECETPTDTGTGFSAPSIVLFDSYDGRTHDNEKAIKGYHYLEYGEVWFDKHSITTAARKIEEHDMKDYTPSEDKAGKSYYEITAGRFDDHMKLIMRSPTYAKEVTIALPGGSKSAYIGLTGENCVLKNILVESTGYMLGAEDITRIAEPVSFIDHMESDIKNVQVDRTRSAYTDSIEIKNRVRLLFHTQSLPGADFVWNCPYVLIFSSDDGKVGGENYNEFALIKLNGENDENAGHASSRFIMNKRDTFPGWEMWKELNRKGIECELTVERKGNRIILKTENLGINIENITMVDVKTQAVYMALTGDQVALTDIRLM